MVTGALEAMAIDILRGLVAESPLVSIQKSFYMLGLEINTVALL